MKNKTNKTNKKNKLNIMLLMLVLSISIVAGCDEANGVNATENEADWQQEDSQEIAAQNKSDLKTADSKTTEQENEKAQKSSDNTKSRKDTQGKSNSQKSDSANKSDSQKKDSKNKKDEDKGRKSEKKVKKGWIFYGSRSTELSAKEKAKLDSMVRSWTQGSISEDGLEEKMCAYLTKQGRDFVTAGIMGRSRCLFDSVNDIPNYSALLKERHGLYNFMGLYTEGKYDSTGHLICYYWEAGVM